MREKIKESRHLHLIPWGLALILAGTAVLCLGYIYTHGEQAIAAADYAEKVNMSLKILETDDYTDNTIYSDLYNVMETPVFVSADGQVLSGSDTEIGEAWYNLIGYSTAGGDARYLMDAYGDSESGSTYNILTGIRNLGGSDQTVLTLNAALQETMYAYLTEYEIEGFVLAYDYTTGGVLCCVSTPGAASSDAVDDLEDGALLNKAFYSTPAGSTMKIVTMLLLTDQGIDLNRLEYTCEGSYTLSDGSVINCTGEHGTVSAAEACAVSCNTFFAQAIEEHLEIYAAMETLQEELGFSVNGSDVQAAIGNISVSASSIRLSGLDGFTTDANVWPLIGEENILVNGAFMMQLAAACASENGEIMTPCFLQDEEGTVSTVFASCTEEIAAVAEVWKEGTQIAAENDPDLNATKVVKSGTYELDSTENGAVQKTLFGASADLGIAFFIAEENFRDADGTERSADPSDIAAVLLENLGS